MEKNLFLLYNDIVSVLYSCREVSDLQTRFLPRLKFLIPYSYASIFLLKKGKEGSDGRIELSDPLCVPESFAQAELSWLGSEEKDHLSWLTRSSESILVRESDLLNEEERLNSYPYQHCYHQYNVYDTLQFAIIDSGQFLGLITLFRTRIDNEFCDDDMFFLRSCGTHLTAVFNRLIFSDKYADRDVLADADVIAARFGLTAREMEILGMVLHFRDNQQIAEDLGIRENTLQKHLYNIFRKLNISSRWEAASWYYNGDWKSR